VISNTIYRAESAQHLLRPSEDRQLVTIGIDFDEIKSMLSGADIVFISAGMGGGTGTGAAPIVAQAAKEAGALTVSVVTSPFKFEGRKRTKLAKLGLEELKRESDSIVIVPNEKLLTIVEKNLGIKESFRLVDDVLTQAVSGISNVILAHGSNDINLDFADVRTVMGHRGMALMGAGKSAGADAAYDAAKTALESPLLDNISINGAMGVLVHFHIHPDYPILEISKAMEIIEENAHEDASVIFGTTTNPDIEPDEVRITIVATGFDDPNSLGNEQAKKANEASSLLKSNGSVNTPIQPTLQQSRRVVGGFDATNEDLLDVPTFLRKQMD
jgi:cell division protein FtsZ